ncbi:MAG TPA: PIN domain-containing protein [Candidatus Nanoarchaeia archaeon]|nr:PIN domain-containing protein [Candidatus Nanoarchaeia archaeon]
MDLVVDANILIAGIISPIGHTADLFFSERLQLYAPDFLLEEIEEHKDEIISKTEFSEDNYEKVLASLASRLKFIPIEELLASIPKAKEISPDLDDLVYFALALKLECPLWSNDKKLKEQGRVKVFSTSELLELLTS